MISLNIFANDQTGLASPPPLETPTPTQQFVTAEDNTTTDIKTPVASDANVTSLPPNTLPSAPVLAPAPVLTPPALAPTGTTLPTTNNSSLLSPNDHPRLLPDTAALNPFTVELPTKQTQAPTTNATALGLNIAQNDASPENSLAGGIDITAFMQCKTLMVGLCHSAEDLQISQTCFSKIQTPSCKQFSAFAKTTNMTGRDDIDFINHYASGHLDLIHLIRGGANYPGIYYTVGENGHVDDLIFGQQNQALDIRKSPDYAQIAEKFPKVELFSIVDQLPEIQQSPDGSGLRLILRFQLLNGCHACERAGYANVAYDFSNMGILTSTSILSMR